jgi:hypothetical protein
MGQSVDFDLSFPWHRLVELERSDSLEPWYSPRRRLSAEPLAERSGGRSPKGASGSTAEHSVAPLSRKVHEVSMDSTQSFWIMA